MLLENSFLCQMVCSLEERFQPRCYGHLGPGNALFDGGELSMHFR